MSELFDKSIRTLELPRVLQRLSDQAVSAEAKERAFRLRPETETEEVLRLLDQTDAARAMIGLHGAPSFSGVKPVAEAPAGVEVTLRQKGDTDFLFILNHNTEKACMTAGRDGMQRTVREVREMPKKKKKGC